MAYDQAPLSIPADKGVLPGLLWAWRFDPTGRATVVPLGQPVNLHPASDDWYWLHFDLVDMRARHWLTGTPTLRDSARLTLLSAQEHPTLHCYDGLVAGCLPDLVREIDGSAEEPSHLRFALSHHVIVTGWRHALQATWFVHQAIEQGQRLSAPGALLQAILDQIAADIAGKLNILSNGFDRIEDELLSDKSLGDNLGLARHRRHLVRAHRRLAGLCALFERVGPSLEKAATATRLQLDSQHCLHRLSALDHEAVAMLERGRLLQDEIATKLATETNRHLHALSILTALLLPPSLVFGVFGMNVGGLPLGQSSYGVFITLTLGALSAAFAFGLLRRLTRFLKRRGVVK